jgi:tRNA A37 threonylcarbamoyladenosine dehydratase
MKFNFTSRTKLLIGQESLEKLENSNVIVFGLGGVGACVAEMLVRAGVGNLTIVDGDQIVLSNLNRQLHTLISNIDKPKAIALQERLLEINPLLNITILQEYIKTKNRFEEILSDKFDVCVDAIDTLSNKVNLILTAKEKEIPIVSSFGAGGRLDPSLVRVGDISETKNCRLAYYTKRKLRKKNLLKGVKVVYSLEKPLKSSITLEEKVQGKKSTIGTISYMPNVFGCFVASEVIKILINKF